MDSLSNQGKANSFLIRLDSGQAAKRWPEVSSYVAASVAPTAIGGPHHLNNILKALIEDRMVMWIAAQREKNNDIKVIGVLTTCVTIDPIAQVRCLEIYSMFGTKDARHNTWVNGLKILKKYAKSEECQKIIGFTQVPKLATLVEQLGGCSDWRFLEFEV